MKKWIYTLLTLFICFGAAPAAELPQWMQDSEFDWLFRVVTMSTLSENKKLFWPNEPKLFERRSEISLRPDFRWRSEWVSLSAKPRMEVYEEAPHAGDPDKSQRSELNAYMYEWKASLHLTEEITASYGREDKQWGPSILLSPSNPFQASNGRNSPKSEAPSSDYAQVDWAVSPSFQLSAMVNTHPGRRKYTMDNFEKVYAVKADWVGEGKQAALIGSVRDGEGRIGMYGLWNINDAWMVYNESGWQKDDLEVLIGTAYTFEHGGMLSAEYFYNGSGEKDGHPLLRTLQARCASPREMLQRQNYVLLQYTQPMIRDVFDVTARWVYNVDDESQAVFLFTD